MSVFVCVLGMESENNLRVGSDPTMWAPGITLSYLHLPSHLTGSESSVVLQCTFTPRGPFQKTVVFYNLNVTVTANYIHNFP